MSKKPDSTPDDTPTADAESHIQKLVEEFEKRLRQEMPMGPVTLEEIERRADRLGEQVKEAVQKELLDLAGTGYVGSSVLCSCQRSARYVALYKKQMVTLCGIATVWRAYYYCSTCRKGFCPLDAHLGLGRSQCTSAVRARLSRFASFLPFGTAAREMEIICGVRLSASTVRREAQAVGRALEQAWAHEEQLVHKNKAPLPAQRPPRLHLSMDGVLLFVGGEWREVKCAVAYETGKDAHGQANGVKTARYCATLARSASFGRRVRTLAHRAGSGRCSRVGIVADGAAWIWQETGKHFPQSVQVLDFYHVCEHLWQVARLRFGQGSAEAAAWMEEQKERLLRDKAEQVRHAVAQWVPVTHEGREVRRKVVSYLETHAHRMGYGSLRQAG